MKKFHKFLKYYIQSVIICSIMSFAAALIFFPDLGVDNFSSREAIQIYTETIVIILLCSVVVAALSIFFD